MNEQIQPTSPSQNDRIMAALGHGAIILPMTGIIAPVVIWATQRDKSQFVAFQALQAIVYQLIQIIAWFAGGACYMGAIFLMIPYFGHVSDTSSALIAIPFFIIGVLLIGMFTYVIYGAAAAVMVLQGKSFRYIIIGNWLERNLQQN